MLNRIQIENFQSHKKSVLELSSGVNVIIGTSDAGKSAIFRAINWVFSNRPRGYSFIRWGTKQTRILLDIDGNQLERIRSSTTNQYILDKTELLPGQEVPDVVSDLLKISSVNIQHQIGAPFLLANTPGEVAQFFNDIAGLSDIDKSTKNIQSDLRGLSKNLEEYKKKEKELIEELEEYKYLDQAEDEIETLENKQQKKNQLSKDIERLEVILKQITWYKEQIQAQRNLAQALDDIQEVEEKQIYKEEIKKQRTALNKLLINMRSYRKKIKYYEKKSKALQMIEQIEKKEQHRGELQKQKQRLNDLIGMISRTQTSLDKETARIHEYQAELQEKMPTTCPLCGCQGKCKHRGG